MEQAATTPIPNPAPTHIGQAVFDLVKAHPGRTMAEYEQLAYTVGVNPASVKNYITNFCKTSWGLAKFENDRYTLCSDTYKTKNEMMGIPKGRRISQAKRRRIMNARTREAQGTVPAAKPARQAQVGRGVLMDLLLGHVKVYPGKSRGHLVAFAIKHGMKEDSAKVTIRSLIKAGRLVEKDDAGLYLPGVHMVDPMEVQAYEPPVMPKPVVVMPVPKKAEIDVEALTIREARALFDQLQKYFSF